jgi:hypothetical protein
VRMAVHAMWRAEPRLLSRELGAVEGHGWFREMLKRRFCLAGQRKGQGEASLRLLVTKMLPAVDRTLTWFGSEDAVWPAPESSWSTSLG